MAVCNHLNSSWKTHAFFFQVQYEHPVNHLGFCQFMMAKIKTMFGSSFKLLCFMGFVYQMTQILREYFEFKTTTKVALELQTELINPSIIFCIRCTDIIDRTNYQKYGIHQKASFNTAEYLSDLSKLTISDIFELTPDPSNTMIKCQFRENEYNVETYNRSHCYSILNITKYQEGVFICYQFRTRIQDTKFRCDQAALSYHSFNELYTVQLHPQFLLSNRIKLISFIPGRISDSLTDLPVISRRFYYTNVRYGTHTPDTSIINYIYVAGDLYSITRLEKPYDTACVDSQEEALYACSRRCNIATFQKHNLFPPNEFTTVPLPLKHSKDVVTSLNTTLIQEIKAMNEECMKDCNKYLCEEWYTVTEVVTSPFLHFDTISIASACSNRPAVVIQHKPKVTLMEVLIYMSSSLGIWFGISFMSINPFQAYRIRTKTKSDNIELNRTLINLLLEPRIKTLQRTISDCHRRLVHLESK